METNAKPLTLYIVQDDKGKIWKSSARLSYDECILAFIGDWLELVRKSLTTYRAGVCWDMFEECGWRVIEIPVPITTETT